jgi:hypothetical protein
MKTRKCRTCQQPGHNSATCATKAGKVDYYTKHASSTDMDPDVTMRTMIDPQYAVWLVTERVIGEALANCTNAIQEARRAGLGGAGGDAMLQALAELHRRSRDIAPELITAAAKAQRKLYAAQAAYREASTKITQQLGYTDTGVTQPMPGPILPTDRAWIERSEGVNQ